MVSGTRTEAAAVSDAKRRKRRVPPRIVTFDGNGLQPGVQSFEDMVSMTDAGRGD